MPNPIIGLAGASIGSSLLSSRTQTRAVERATDAQTAATEAASEATLEATRLSVDEIRAAREAQEEILRPYVEVGTGSESVQGSLQAQQALLGLLGDEEQANAISAIEQGAEYQALARQGEEAILQNAAATGGLRGGNVQGALAQFRPALLNQAITDRYNRLGGLTQIGQASAAGVGSAGIGAGQNIANLLTSGARTQAGLALGQGENLANAAIARGNIGSNLIGSLSQIPGLLIGGF